MNEERKNRIRNKIKKVFNVRHDIADFLRRRKEILALTILLSSQVAKDLSAQTSVKDKKIDYAGVVAQQKANGNYEDYRAYLENCERLTKEDMTKLIDKGIKDGHLIPQLDNHFAVYTVNPDNPGPFVDTKDFYALTNKETGELLFVSQGEKDKVVISNFNQNGTQLEGSVSGVKSVIDSYEDGVYYRQVEKSDGKVLTQFYYGNEKGMRTPILDHTWSQDGDKLTVHNNPNNLPYKNPGGTTVYYLYANHKVGGDEGIAGVAGYEEYDASGRIMKEVENEKGSFKKATVYTEDGIYVVNADYDNKVVSWSNDGNDILKTMSFDDLMKARKLCGAEKVDLFEFASAQTPDNVTKLEKMVVQSSKSAPVKAPSARE